MSTRTRKPDPAELDVGIAQPRLEIFTPSKPASRPEHYVPWPDLFRDDRSRPEGESLH